MVGWRIGAEGLLVGMFGKIVEDAGVVAAVSAMAEVVAVVFEEENAVVAVVLLGPELE